MRITRTVKQIFTPPYQRYHAWWFCTTTSERICFLLLHGKASTRLNSVRYLTVSFQAEENQYLRGRPLNRRIAISLSHRWTPQRNLDSAHVLGRQKTRKVQEEVKTSRGSDENGYWTNVNHFNVVYYFMWNTGCEMYQNSWHLLVKQFLKMKRLEKFFIAYFDIIDFELS